MESLNALETLEDHFIQVDKGVISFFWEKDRLPCAITTLAKAIDFPDKTVLENRERIDEVLRRSLRLPFSDTDGYNYKIAVARRELAELTSEKVSIAIEKRERERPRSTNPSRMTGEEFKTLLQHFAAIATDLDAHIQEEEPLNEMGISMARILLTGKTIFTKEQITTLKSIRNTLEKDWVQNDSLMNLLADLDGIIESASDTAAANK